MRKLLAAVQVTCLLLVLALPAGPALAGPRISAVRTTGKCIALTFDDGPHASLTPRLLDILRAQGVKATFFVVGSRVQSWPSVVRRASREGHEIGNHMWSHPVLPNLGSESVARQLASTDAAIVRATGKAPKVLRAPYGSLSGRVAGLDRRPFIGWSVDTQDWRYKGSARIVSHVLARSRSGGIVLMHDIHGRTVAAVPAIISGLKKRGYRLVTVSELLGGQCGGQRMYAGDDRSTGVAASGRGAGTVAASEAGPLITKTTPSGRAYSYQQGSGYATYTINGRTFRYNRD